MGKNTRLMELPTRMLEVALGSERRWKRVAVASVLLVGIAGTAAWFGIRGLEGRGAEALATDVGSLEICLLGEPLADGETADARARGVQLTVLGTPRADRAKPGEQPWPQRCATFAAAVSDKLGPDDALGAASAALAKALKEDAPALEEPVAKTWEAIGQKGIVAQRGPGAPPAPKPLVPAFSRTAFAQVPTFLGGNFALSSLRPEEHPGAKARFVVDEKLEGGPRYCTVGAGDAAAKCQPVGAGAAKHAGRLRLVGTAGGADSPILTAENGTLGVFTVGAAEPIATQAIQDAAVVDGAVTLLLGEVGKDLDVQLRKAPGPDGKVVGAPIKALAVPGSEIGGPGLASLLWDRLAYQGTRAGKTPHLWVRGRNATGLDPAADLGEVTDPAPDALAGKERLVDGCRSPAGELSAVRVRGAKNDLVSVFVGGRWSAIFPTGTRGGEVVCHPTEVTSTEVEHAAEGGSDTSRNLAVVRMSRCAAGCTTAEVKLSQVLSETDVFPPDASSFAAVDVGGKLALVWSSPRGGVRLRVGAPDELRSAKDQLLFDGFEHGASKEMPSFNAMRLLPFDGHALLFLGTRSGVRAFRIDPDGKITAVASEG